MKILDKMPTRIRQAIIGVIGSIVLIVGIIAIPYPGPGWIIVFAGLAILATEFVWAERLLGHARGKYDAWQTWLGRQLIYTKIVVWTITFLVVITTIWLLNGYGLANTFFHLNQDWLRSPFSR